MNTYNSLAHTDFFEYEEDPDEYLVFDNIIDYMRFITNKPLDYPCSLNTSFIEETSVCTQNMDVFVFLLIEKYQKNIIDVPPRQVFGHNVSTIINLGNISNYFKYLDVRVLLSLFYNLPKNFPELYSVFVRRWPYRKDIWALFIDIACVTKPTIYTCELHVDEYVYQDEYHTGPYANREYYLQDTSLTPIEQKLDTYPICKCVLKYRMGVYKDTTEEIVAQYNAQMVGKRRTPNGLLLNENN